MHKYLLYIIGMILFISTNSQGKSYNLEQFLSLVENNSKQLKIIKQDKELAQANKKEAMSGALPNVFASAGYRRNLSDLYIYADFSTLNGDDSGNGDSNGNDIAKFKINSNNEYNFNLTVSQTIFSGAVFYAIRAAKEYKQLTDKIYDASRSEIMTFSQKAFYQTLLLKHVWQVTKASEQNAYENYIDMKNGYESGLKSEFAMLQAEVRYRDLIPQTSETERNYNLALLNLKDLAGVSPDEEFSLDGSLEIYPDIPPDVEFGYILEKRPDFNALLWEEKLRTTAVNAEKSGYLPSLAGYFTYAFSSQSDEFNFDNQNNSYMVGLNLSFPIFTGGRTKARVNRANIELLRTKLTVDKTRDDISREVCNIKLRINEAFKRIESAKVTLSTAEKAFSIAEATSKSGLITQLELKDARIGLDQAQLNYYAAIYEYLDAYFDWQKATGNLNNS